jgi:hypothetical protein
VTPANPSSDMPSSSNSCKKKLTPRRRKQWFQERCAGLFYLLNNMHKECIILSDLKF